MATQANLDTATTREHLLSIATRLFAERGFYGVSIAQVADEMGLTKQALLHHFKTKEKLYGEVLKGIAEHYDGIVAAHRRCEGDPRARLGKVLRALKEDPHGDNTSCRLLMRELLDNPHRANAAGRWYLADFLRGLMAMVRALPHWQDRSESEVLAATYQLLGAVNYYGISGPTLAGIFGQALCDELDGRFDIQLTALIAAL